MLSIVERWTTPLLLAASLCLAAATAFAQDAAALQQRYAQLQPVLANNAYGRPLHIESRQASGDLSGDVHAVVAHPFAHVQRSLASRDNWCDLLILHLNVKQCAAPKGSQTVTLHVGKKFDQPLEDAYAVNFNYRVAAQTADYLEVQMAAAEGPLGTRNYRIALRAVPIDAQRTFVRLSYAYGYGMAARLAMQGYLSTVGSGKIGFTVVDRDRRGEPEYVGGVRGVVERNTMRYYLAIESFLGTTDVDKRLRDWFAATERYAPQLREMTVGEYLEMKRREIRRQDAL